MMRTLAAGSAVGLAAVSMFWSTAALALGLGDVEVRSRLNERFAASIPLDAATPEDLESLTIRIAEAEEFTRRGLERSELVNTLRFERNGGRVQVVSAQAVRDPFLNFIVEARWNGGRLLREYTVLLDPPTAGSTPVAAPPRPAATIAAPTPLPLPAAPAPASASAAKPASTATTPAAALPGRYGPVQASQTLWSIAKLLRRDPAVTMDQMLLAIYRSNPTAFGGGSINHLLSGQMLVVPSTADVLAIDPGSASEQVLQLRATGRPPLVPSSPPAAVPAPAVAADVSAPAIPVEAPLPAEPPATEPAAVTEATAVPAVDAEAPAVAVDAAEAVVEAAPPAPPAPAAIAAATPPPDQEPLPWGLIGGLLLLIVALIAVKLRQRKLAEAEVAPASSTAVLAAGPDPLLERSWSRAPVQQASPAVTDAADPALPAAASPASDDAVTAIAPIASSAATVAANLEMPGKPGLGPSLDAGDPLTEADFHLAYGLYDEAAQMLQKAIASAPERSELKIKLAETYSAAGQAEAFRTLAEGLAGTLSPGEWQKISVMGRALLPELPLFGGAPQAPEAAMTTEATEGELPRDLSVIDFDLDVELAQQAPVTLPAAPSLPEAPRVTMPDPVTEGLLLPLDEPVLAFDLPPAAAPAAAPPAPAPLESPPPPPPPPEHAATIEAPTVLDIDLSSFDLDDEPFPARTDPLPVKPAPSFLTLPADEPGFEFEPEPESEVIGGDEIDTKLDLARAYADMGDLDAARTLLAEVEISGSDKQQQEARALSQRLQG